MGVLCNCLLGCLTLLRDTINSLVLSKSSLPRTNRLTRRPAVGDRPKKKRHAGFLAHVVSGMYYSVDANRRQPNQYIIGGGWRSHTLTPQTSDAVAVAPPGADGGFLGWLSSARASAEQPRPPFLRLMTYCCYSCPLYVTPPIVPPATTGLSLARNPRRLSFISHLICP